MEKDLKGIVTFKQSEKWIYDEIQKHSGKGNWVKDVLSAYIVLCLKRYHALCLLKTSDGYARFVVKLPGKI